MNGADTLQHPSTASDLRQLIDTGSRDGPGGQGPASSGRACSSDLQRRCGRRCGLRRRTACRCNGFRPAGRTWRPGRGLAGVCSGARGRPAKPDVRAGDKGKLQPAWRYLAHAAAAAAACRRCLVAASNATGCWLLFGLRPSRSPAACTHMNCNIQTNQILTISDASLPTPPAQAGHLHAGGANHTAPVRPRRQPPAGPHLPAARQHGAAAAGKQTGGSHAAADDPLCIFCSALHWL